MACGVRTRIRAAASSIASGRPSSRTQISATAGAFSFVDREVGPHGLGALDEQAHRLVLGQRARCGEVGPRSGRPAAAPGTRARRRRAAAPARDQHLQAREARPAARDDLGAAIGHLLEVVEDEQQLRCRRCGRRAGRSRVRPPRSGRPSACAMATATRSASRRRERHEEDAVRIAVGEPRRDLQREAGLAGAARPGQRQQAGRVEQRPATSAQLVLAPEERRELGRQVVRDGIECLRRRERRPSRPSIDELVEALGARQVLEAMLAQVAEGDVGGRLRSTSARVVSERSTWPPCAGPRCARRGGRRCRRSHRARSPVPRGGRSGPGSARRAAMARQRGRAARPPRRGGPRSPIGNATKNESPSVPTSTPPLAPIAARHDCDGASSERRPSLAESSSEARRALDVAEEEGDGPGRKLGHSSRSTRSGALQFPPASRRRACRDG